MTLIEVLTFVRLGTALLDMAPIQSIEGGCPWVNFIDNKDNHIQYEVSDAAKTGLPDASTDVVLLEFLPDKLPHLVTMKVFRSCSKNDQIRISKKGQPSPN